MVRSSEQANDLIDLVEKQGNVFAVTYNYTGYPMVKQARHMVREGKLGDMKVVEFGLRGPEHETVLKMLWLWRGNFAVGEPSLPTPLPPKEPRRKPDSGPPLPPADEWVALSDFDPPTKTPPPSQIRFPDGATSPVSRWHDLKVAVVRWLQEADKLGPSDCPVCTAGGIHLVHTSPVHDDGGPFRVPIEVGALWLNKGALTGDINTRMARRILSEMGVDPATVHVLPRSD